MLEKVQADRLAKLEQIRALGIDPYGGRYDTAEAIDAVLKRFGEWERQRPAGAAEPAATGQAQGEPAPADLPRGDAAGRLVLIRDMGKMIFAHLRDESGQMQIALRKNALDERSWSLAKLLDLGDLVAAAGPIQRTRTNEVTIWADRLTLLAKSLNPMPEKFHGLSDVETRYRRRYLDLMTNPDSLKVFQKRIAVLEHFRALLKARGFVEVETPMMQPLYGGAAARPFTTHHNALDCDLYLRISPELYLKRLLVGGMTKVYEINRNFRNEGLDTRHNPEFTMLELYQAHADYEVMMEITEELIGTAAKSLCDRERLLEELSRLEELQKKLPEEIQEGRVEAVSGRDAEKSRYWAGIANRKTLPSRIEAYKSAIRMIDDGKIALPFGGMSIDYSEWLRKTYDELLIEHADVSMRDPPAVRAKARELKIEEANKDDAVVVNAVFEACVEPALAKMDRPVFVKDYPAELCPLTRRKADDPSVALRFECYIAGMEIANAYTELNDPAVQEANFRRQLRGEAEGETMRVMDEDFVAALRHGMPPAGGLGIGIDRVVMLLTDTQSIRDVVFFPMLRPEAARREMTNDQGPMPKEAPNGNVQ